MKAAPAISQATAPMARAGTVASLGKTIEATNASSAEIAMKARLSTPDVDRECERAGERPGALGGLGPLLSPRDPPHDPLDRTVGRARDLPDLAPDVVQEPDALGGDCGAHLGRLGDPLDELLRLVAREQPLPHCVDELAVEGVDQRPLDRRAVERAAHRLLDGRPLEDSHESTLDSRALHGADDRLLGRRLDRAVHAGGLGDPPCTAGAAAEQSGGKRRPGFLHSTSLRRTRSRSAT